MVAVLITGATRGLGRSIVEALATRRGNGESSHAIFCGCRDMHAGAELASNLHERFGGGGAAFAHPVQLDVTDGESVAAAAATITAHGHRLDAVVNNAGVLLEREGCALAGIVEPSLAVNFDGLVSVTEAFLPLIRDGGQIINVSSGAGTRTTGSLSDATRAELAACADAASLREVIAALARDSAARPHESGETPIYGLSKCAVNYYTQLLARSTSVCVNACSPGFCDTEIAGPKVAGGREPKEPSLGATVVLKLLFGELGNGTGGFYKESSRPGTPLHLAKSVEESWVS